MSPLIPMETPGQKTARLVTALEDLVAREAAALQARDFPDAIAIQGRAAPVVQLLASLANEVPDNLRPRIEALLSRRQQSDAWLAGEIEIVRAKLQETGETQRRIARFAPAYGKSGVACGRLSAVG